FLFFKSASSSVFVVVSADTCRFRAVTKSASAAAQDCSPPTPTQNRSCCCPWARSAAVCRGLHSLPSCIITTWIDQTRLLCVWSLKERPAGLDPFELERGDGELAGDHVRECAIQLRRERRVASILFAEVIKAKRERQIVGGIRKGRVQELPAQILNNSEV